MDLPEAAASRPVSGKTHTIRITPDNTLVFDHDPIGVRELSFRLKSLKDRAAGAAVRLSSQKTKRPPATGTAPIVMTVTVKYQYGL